jgi:CheY-like chemotaxis protein
MFRIDKKITRSRPHADLASFMLFLHQDMAKKILIADSNDGFRESLREFIRGLGYDVSVAATGSQTLENAFNDRPDLVIIEVRLPDINGDEVTAQLKRNSSTRNVPVILNTGWTTACNVEEKINRALSAGADEILYRPLQFSLLRNVLRTYLFA